LMLRRDRWFAGTLLGAFAVHTVVVGTYRAPQTVEYALPAYVLIAVMVGWLAGQCGYRQRTDVAALALTSIGLTFHSGWVTMRRLASQEEARQVASQQTGVVLAQWHRATPLWYLQQVEGVGVDVHYVAPQGTATPMETWVNTIERYLTEYDS